MHEFLQTLEGLSAGSLYALIALFAAVENFFPPVPADTVIALGAFLAGRGKLDAWTVFGIGWAANVGGAAALYGLARRYGRPLFRGRFGRRLLPEAVLEHLEREYHRHGAYGIFLSRLLPVWRGVVTPFAGIAGLSPGRALPPVALASALWYGGLTVLIVRLAPSLDTVLRHLGRVNRVLGAVALLAIVVLVVVVLRRLKR
ncbi:MAG TPA: DedA family protein [Gemmatimonadales bacterium]|nr:DedA family protein [Gemmatimonadales bacterium]